MMLQPGSSSLQAETMTGRMPGLVDEPAMIIHNGKPKIKRVGVASAFSPRFLPVLSDAAKFAERCHAALSFLHVGPHSDETDNRFRSAVQQLQVRANATVVYKESDSVVEALLSMAANDSVDLLVAGALERETAGRAFLGNVARTLLRYAPCPLLLFTHPQISGTRFKKIVVATDFSAEAEQALHAAHWLAQKDHAECLYVFSIFTPFNEARRKAQTQRLFESGTSKEETERLEAFVAPLEHSSVPIDFRVIRATTGFAASEFVQSVDADLLVMPARRDSEGGILFPPYMDWVFQVIPANLWIVTSQRYT